MFKYLPDAKIAWRDSWLGAFVTALLFVVGKHLIGFYLGQTTVASSFGAAGSVVVFMIWVYYAALILLFGAEITQAVADAARRGRRAERAREPQGGLRPARGGAAAQWSRVSTILMSRSISRSSGPKRRLARLARARIVDRLRIRHRGGVAAGDRIDGLARRAVGRRRLRVLSGAFLGISFSCQRSIRFSSAARCKACATRGAARVHRLFQFLGIGDSKLRIWCSARVTGLARACGARKPPSVRWRVA